MSNPFKINLKEYYGRDVTREEVESTFNQFNTLPPGETKFCKRCGSSVKWYKETPGFSVRTGKSGHTYHLKCPLFGVAGWDWETENPNNAWAKGKSNFSQIVIHGADMHYDSGYYRFIESDVEFFEITLGD